jgi:hypothetical protein
MGTALPSPPQGRSSPPSGVQVSLRASPVQALAASSALVGHYPPRRESVPCREETLQGEVALSHVDPPPLPAHSLPSLPSLSNRCLDPEFLALLDITDINTLTQMFDNPPFISEKLACKCLLHLPRWKSTCGGEEFMKIGMTHYWREDLPPPNPNLLLVPPQHYKLDKIKEEALATLLQEELDQDVIVQVHHSAVRLYNPIFPVPKPGNKWRKILDNTALCNLQKDIHYKMENEENIISMALPNDWATSLDLKSAFNHLLVQEDVRPYLAFSFRGKSYWYRAMPFGAKHAPRLFTKAFSYAIQFIRQNWSVRIMSYMDDVLILHQDPKYLHVATLQIALYLSSLGWTINRGKSEVIPKQQITFLGWSFDFQHLSLSMTPARRASCLGMLKTWIKKVYSGSSVPMRSLSSLIGSLSFLRRQLPRAGLYLRALHSNLAQGVRSNGWNGLVTLNRRTASELLW